MKLLIQNKIVQFILHQVLILHDAIIKRLKSFLLNDLEHKIILIKLQQKIHYKQLRHIIFYSSFNIFMLYKYTKSKIERDGDIKRMNFLLLLVYFIIISKIYLLQTKIR